MVAVNLCLKVFLAVMQMLQGIMHASHFLLALEPLTMLTPDITCNSIEDALESIASCDLSKLLQLKKEEYGVRLDFFER